MVRLWSNSWNLCSKRLHDTETSEHACDWDIRQKLGSCIL